MSRAVVIGGSIGGMCAARALADAFDEVVIVDRDRYPSDATFRAGVPQSRHAHALLDRGQLEIEGLFPGFTQAMREAGALSFDVGSGFAMRRRPGWQDVGDNGVASLFSSRDLLEHTIRTLLRAQTRIELRERTQVIGLLGDAARITGVRVRTEGAGESELSADLVLEASGRNSQMERWLEALRITPPHTQRVDAKAGYASRFYQAPPAAERPSHWWWKGLWVEWQPPDLARGAVIFPLENERWLVTLAGIGDDVPPTDEAGYLGFLNTLSSPSVARAVALATPISEISGNRSLANVFRRYDQWPSAPPGLLALGDAVCGFNPIYGQGMSSAAACAGILRAVLRERGRAAGFERELFARQGAFLESVWNLATGADFLWPTTEGERPKVPAPIGAYLSLAMETAHCDAAARRHIAPVFNLTADVKLFFSPGFLLTVLAKGGARRLRRRLRGEPVVPDEPPPKAASPA